ncbi:MAG: transcriptional repressor LexA [Desulfocapsaceae bacterium]|jgi:repressor LexA|nr:transcriptional repressor LexA [Desulfocapsaceae bacterium]
MNLTKKQQRFLDYLKNHFSREGQAPSLRAAAADLGVSHTAVAQLLAQLEKKGVVEREGRYSRSIRLTSPVADRAERSVGREVPVIGQVTAGMPMYAQQEWDGSVIVDGRLFRGDNLFCLRIKGDSMCAAGIFDGDLAICEPRQYAENGEVVAVLIHNEEATVKRFFLKSDCVELRPENDAYPIMQYRFNELLVQGKVVGVVRGPHPLFSAAPY